MPTCEMARGETDASTGLGELYQNQKSHYQQLLKAGGMPSYGELLTCLEMDKNVKSATKDKTEDGHKTPLYYDAQLLALVGTL